MIVDKRLPCESGDLVVIYPLPEAAKSGAQPSIVFLQTVLSPGIKLLVRLHPESEVRLIILVKDTKTSKKARIWNAQDAGHVPRFSDS